MNRWRKIAVCAAFASYLGGCGGSSSTQSHVTPPVKVTNQANASLATIGTVSLALAKVKAASYYARYLRPGVGPSLGTLLVNKPTPTCDASTQSASMTTVDPETTQNYSVLTAYYPAGDTTCSQSPVAAVYMYYPVASLPQNGTPQTGYGYVLHYAGANDPVFSAVGAFMGAESIWTSIYNLADGRANIDTEILPRTLGGSGFQPAPSPGTFPATFPVGLPLPQSIAAEGTDGGTYFATVESSSQQSQTGIAFTESRQFQPLLGLAASASINVTTRSASGTETLSATEADAAYSFDTSRLVVENASDPTHPYDLGAGNTTWTLTQPSTQGILANNFNASQDSMTASYASNGSIAALHLVEIDTVNGIRCQLDSTAANSFALKVTDLRANAPATRPATVLLDGDGNSQPFTLVLDGSASLIRSFDL